MSALGDVDVRMATDELAGIWDESIRFGYATWFLISCPLRACLRVFSSLPATCNDMVGQPFPHSPCAVAVDATQGYARTDRSHCQRRPRCDNLLTNRSAVEKPSYLRDCGRMPQILMLPRTTAVQRLAAESKSQIHNDNPNL